MAKRPDNAPRDDMFQRDIVETGDWRTKWDVDLEALTDVGVVRIQSRGIRVKATSVAARESAAFVLEFTGARVPSRRMCKSGSGTQSACVDLMHVGVDD